MNYPITEKPASWLKILALVSRHTSNGFVSLDEVRGSIRQLIIRRYRKLLFLNHIEAGRRKPFESNIEDLMRIEVELCLAKIPIDLQAKGIHLLPHKNEWVFVGFKVSKDLNSERQESYQQQWLLYSQRFQAFHRSIYKARECAYYY